MEIRSNTTQWIIGPHRQPTWRGSDASRGKSGKCKSVLAQRGTDPVSRSATASTAGWKRTAEIMDGTMRWNASAALVLWLRSK